MSEVKAYELSGVKVTKAYGGIDYFRLIAAFLIVAIHTSPLDSIDVTADFILTRIIARVAVPFFFMTTGFFLFSDGRNSKDRVKRFLRRTGFVYGASIILYIPLNIYMNYFRKGNIPYQMIKDLLFNGTIYHLWYLPAAMLGVILVAIMIKRFSFSSAICMAGILYLIGIFGDSYYGIAVQSSTIEAIYKVIFRISDYTRNGLFFAPIYLVLGGMIGRNRKQINIRVSFAGFFISLTFLLVEGLLLRRFQLMRHDSMYLMLVPCMYYLFTIILRWNIPSCKELRTISLLIYLIHPMVIVMVRAVAKRLELQDILIDHSVTHFLIVALGSWIIAVGVTLLQDKSETNKSEAILKKTGRSWIEIDLNNLKHNARELKGYMPTGCEMMAVVKANAYGHGAVRVSKCLNDIGVKDFAVATIDEGIELRKKGIKGDILVLGYTDISRVDQLIRYRLIQTIIDYEYALQLNEHKQTIEVHVKIDTGMHRLGISVDHTDKIREVFHLKHLRISGIFTHLCNSDSLQEEAVQYTKGQIDRFYRLLHELEKKGIKLPKVHIQSSYGLLNYPNLQCDYARIGIALYGSLSSQGDRTNLQPDLRPVLTLKARIAMIREVAAGEGICYGRDVHVTKNSQIAVLPLGYADGLPRNLFYNSVLLRGMRVPIIGRICMDQLLIDVTDIPHIKPGEIVTLIGVDGLEEIKAENMAKNAGTITNEIFSRIGSRIDRLYI